VVPYRRWPFRNRGGSRARARCRHAVDATASPPGGATGPRVAAARLVGCGGPLAAAAAVAALPVADFPLVTRRRHG